MNIRNQASDFHIFSKETDGAGVEVRVDREHETIWLTQKLMADLFETTTQNIQQHLDAIYRSEELDEDSTIKNFLIVRQERSRSVKRQVKRPRKIKRSAKGRPFVRPFCRPLENTSVADELCF